MHAHEDACATGRVCYKRTPLVPKSYRRRSHRYVADLLLRPQVKSVNYSARLRYLLIVLQSGTAPTELADMKPDVAAAERACTDGSLVGAIVCLTTGATRPHYDCRRAVHDEYGAVCVTAQVDLGSAGLAQTRMCP